MAQTANDAGPGSAVADRGDEARRQRVRELLPELQLIEDATLRQRVVDAWVLAWRESGIASLESAPFLAGGEVREGVGLEHMRQTARLTAAIVEQQALPGAAPPNRDVAVAGALLHDIGKLRAQGAVSRQAPVRHAIWGVHVALAVGLSEEVAHIVAGHSFEGDLLERSIECMAVRYADFLSADALFRRELGISGNAYLKKHGFPPK